jgi:hypothetical protein
VPAPRDQSALFFNSERKIPLCNAFYSLVLLIHLSGALHLKEIPKIEKCHGRSPIN